MKKFIYFVFIISFCFNSHSLLAQAIQVDCSTENVGIGCAPDLYKDLKVNSTRYAPTISASSLYLYSIYPAGTYGSLTLSSTSVLSINGTPYNTNALNISSGGATNAMYVDGAAWYASGGDVIASSDLRIKKNIQSLDGKEILERFKNFDGKRYNLKNKGELIALHKSGAITFPVDTINLFKEAEHLLWNMAGKNPSLLLEFNSLDNNGKNEELKNNYFDKVKNIFDFDEIINDSLGIVIRVPRYNETANQFGFIAQEIETQFPELVKLDSGSNIQGINYDGFIPLLLQAIKAQQQQIEALHALVSAQESDIIDLKSVSQKSATIDEETTGESMLYQNTPNPFSQSTRIKYYLANNVADALISICNLNGTQLKSIPIHQTGEGSITIERETLQPGIYLYALVANGQLVDTKKMMLTE